MKVNFNTLNTIYKPQNFTSKKDIPKTLEDSFSSSNPLVIAGLGLLKPFELAKYMLNSANTIISRSEKVKNEIMDAKKLAQEMQSKAQELVDYSNSIQNGAKDRIVPPAKQALKNSKEIYQNAQFLQKEAIEKFKLAQKDGFVTSANTAYYIDEENNKIFIEEFEYGELYPYKVSIFNQDKNNKTIMLSSIIEGDCEYSYENGQCLGFCEGIEETKDACKMQKRYTFENGKLKYYEEGVIANRNSAESVENYYAFYNDNLTSYINNITSYPDGRETSDEIYFFENDTVRAFNKNQEFDADYSSLTDEIIMFCDGKIKSYQYCTKDSPKMIESKDAFEFSDNQLSVYQKNISKDNEGTQKSDIKIVYDGKYFKEYQEGVTSLQDSSLETKKDIKDNFNLTQYSINVIGKANYEGGLDESFIFRNDELTAYIKGVNVLKNGIKKIAQAVGFEDGKLQKFSSLTQEYEDGSSKSAFILFFKNDKLQRFIQNYFEPAHGRNCSASKNLVVDENGKLIPW